MRKGFTLIELVVAVAILAMVISFATVVFKVSIKAHRIASANMEIMQKMRAITDQLNADFKGSIANAPAKIRFVRDAESYEDNKLHYLGTEDTIAVGEDSIIFFANGDFQSTGQYDYEGTEKTVTGTAACIYYGIWDVSATEELDPKKKVLVRRQTIITGDGRWEDNNLLEEGDLQEYCEESLAYLLANLDADDMDNLMDPITLQLDDEVYLSMYMAKGVDDFTIQYVGTEDPPVAGKEFNEWRPDDDDDISDWLNKDLGPVALKFSFTIYDSRGVIEKGRRFTHIVYLLD